MRMPTTRLLLLTLLIAAPAWARFGSKSGHSSSSSPSSSSSSSSSTNTHHSATAVGTNRTPSSSTLTTGSSSARLGGRARFGFFGGGYVPRYGYGFGVGYGFERAYGVVAPPVVPAEKVDDDELPLRVAGTVEGMGFTNTERGFALGVGVLFEGEHWGFSGSAQNLSALAHDGSGEFESLQQFNGHATYAILTGERLRVRLELGADIIFAPDLIVLGPTGGLSGSVWLGGPVALEASVMATPWPFHQVDARAGVVVGVGALGLRAGWRAQLLDDQGLVDGVTNRDVYSGPYVGLGLAL